MTNSAFAAALAAQAPISTPIEAQIGRLSEPERVEVWAAMDDPSIPHIHIQAALEAIGIQASVSTVGRLRRLRSRG